MKQFLVSFLIFITTNFYAQSGEKPEANSRNNIVPLEKILDTLEVKFKVNFSYPNDLISGKKAVFPNLNENLDDILFFIGLQTEISFSRIDKKYIYLTKSNAKLLDKILITSYLTKGIIKRSDGSFMFSPRHFGQLPGLTNNDILASLRLLPGIVSANDSASDFMVHGGNTDENGILWDGIKIFFHGHLFGLISPFNPNVPEKVRFIYKGTDSEFGDNISSILQINTKQKISHKLEFQAEISGIDADIVLNFPIIKNKLSVQTSYRRSYEDIYETPMFDLYEKQAFQNSNIRRDYYYFKDYNLKINYKPNNHNYFGISTLHIDNDLKNRTNQNTNNSIDKLDTENDGFSFLWINKRDSNHKWKTNFAYSKYIFNSKYNNFYSNNNIIYYRQNFIKNGNFKTSFTSKKTDYSLKMGLESDYKLVSYLIKNHDTNEIYDDDNSKLFTQSLFGTIQKSFGKKWTISGGLRINYYSNLQKLAIEPRIIINKKINNYFNLQITAENKHQTINQLRQTVLSDFYERQRIWRLADDNKYPILSSQQITSGILFKKNKIDLDLDIYFKHTKGITSYSMGFLNPNDPVLHKGEQRALGLDFFAKRKFKNLDIWTSYSFMLAQRKFVGINNNGWFTSDNQIQNSLDLVVNYSYKNWDLSLGWKIHSGLPFTEFETEDNSNNLYEFEGINNEELPVFNSLDFSGRYKFHISTKLRGILGLSLKNITNNKTVLNMNYLENNNTNPPIRSIKYYSVGFIPDFFIRIKM